MQICLYWKAIDTSWYYQWYYYHVISCNHIIVLYTVDRRKKSDNHQNDLTALLDCAFHFSECWEFSALLPWRSFLRLSLINTQVLSAAFIACVEISFNNFLILFNNSVVTLQKQGDGLNGIDASLFLVPQLHLVTSGPLVEVSAHWLVIVRLKFLILVIISEDFQMDLVSDGTRWRHPILLPPYWYFHPHGCIHPESSWHLIRRKQGQWHCRCMFVSVSSPKHGSRSLEPCGSDFKPVSPSQGETSGLHFLHL